MNFQDNGYNKHKIDTIIKNYKPNTRHEKYTDRLRTRNKTKGYKINKNITHVSIPYIKHLNNALKKDFNRNNVSYYTHAGPKLGSILCNNNKTDRMQKKGVYKIHCSCDPNKVYIGQTRMNIATRMFQHKKDVESTKQDENISDISKHARICSTGTIIKTYNEKNKLQRDLLIRKSLEIKKNDSIRKGYNDPQLIVKSSAWELLMKRIQKSTNGGTQRTISQ